MEIFEQALRAFLINVNVTGSRVFLMQAPQNPAPQAALPFLVFFPIAAFPYHSHLGPLQVVEREYQISIFDKSQSTALAIADTIRGALDGFQGDVLAPWRIDAALYQTQTWLREEQTQIFHVVQDYRIQFRQLVPLVKQSALPTAVQPAVTLERST